MRPPLGEIDGRRFDVAVIGGGINGASAAQHLAAAGYAVILVEMNDYASGATNRSTRILHSGLRYLAPARSLLDHLLQPRQFAGRVRTAVESIEVMGELVRTLPERHVPVSMAMPVYADMPYRGWHVDLAVRFLRLFDRHGVRPPYRRFKPGDPAMPKAAAWFRDQEKITDVAVFGDWSFRFPERICMDMLLDARRLGAVVRNYTKMTGMRRAGDAWELTLAATEAPGETATVTAPLVINTAGVWMDAINRASAVGGTTPGRRIMGIKGAHIVVKLPPDFAGEGIAALNRHNEAIFALPWGEHHYIGPTETIYEGDLDDVTPDEDDVAFLLDEANHLLPRLRLRRQDVVFAWAGVRPMTYHPAYPKGRRLPMSILHDLSAEGLPGVLALTWGSIHLHRVSGRNLLKAVRRKLPPSRPAAAPGYAAIPFPEAPNSPPVVAGEPGIRLADIAHAARKEDAAHLVDLLFRRTHAGWIPTLTRDEAHRAAEAAGAVLGWDGARIAAEVEAFAAHMRRRHLVELR